MYRRRPANKSGDAWGTRGGAAAPACGVPLTSVRMSHTCASLAGHAPLRVGAQPCATRSSPLTLRGAQAGAASARLCSGPGRAASLLGVRVGGKWHRPTPAAALRITHAACERIHARAGSAARCRAAGAEPRLSREPTYELRSCRRPSCVRKRAHVVRAARRQAQRRHAQRNRARTGQDEHAAARGECVSCSRRTRLEPALRLGPTGRRPRSSL
jgi:hypothetical protein